ncbi:unnamed protein product [Caenorhabditis brenneri]
MEISETSHNESGPPIRENGTVESPAEDEVNDEESNMETVDLGMDDTSATDASSPNVFKNIDNEAPEGPPDVTSSEEAAEAEETSASEEKVEEIVIPSVPTPAPPQDVSPTAAIESLPPLPEGKELELEDDVTSSLPRLLSKTTLIHSNEEGADETIQRLVTALHSNSPNTDRTQIVDNLFNLLVGGHFDQESKFVIEEASNVDHMLTLLSHCDADLQNEIWSLFLAVMKKSNRNLEACTRVGLISKVLDLLPEAPPLLADLLVQIIAALVAYSINVKQTKHLLRALKSTKDQWPPNSLKLLHVLKEMPQHDSADVFFSFPGKDQSGIILPPIKMMPYQQGWTFATWLRMEPLNSVTFEKEQPVLYSFRTSKGIGYSCHFTGNCLVVNVEKTKGKEQSRCIRAELGARKWHHIAIAHCYSRWGRSDIKCFIDGQLAETIELSWVVTSPTNWDRCSIGGSADGTANTAFCGQMGAMYLFAEALSLQQANSLFCLGPAYQSTFKHDSETSLPEGYKKHLFDGHLHSSLVFAYCPKNCHGQLCLYTPPKTAANTYFVQIPHAVMKEGVEVITTHSIHKSLQSVGGIQILLPLFAQIDLPSSHDNSIDGEVCQTLLSLISLLLSSSQSSQQQLFHSKGFLIISSCLQKASPSHLSMKVLEQLIHIAKFLLRCPAGGPLLKHLFDYILFNPKLWIRARPEVQVHLYQYLATDFLANNNFSSMLRRVPTVIEMCHTLKHFYWLALPQTASDYTVEERPENFATADIVAIRSAILTFINRIVVAPSGSPEEEEKSRDQEVHTLLNLLATVREDDNLYDVLALVTRLLAEQPAIMIPAIDKNKALGIIFNLLAAPNELIRIPALKILGYFLARSTIKRKTESMGNQNLFSLIGERLLSHKRVLSLPTYNVLLEILVEQMTSTFSYAAHQPAQPEWKFENPQLLKVIAHVISQCDESESIVQIKKCFLIDIINLCRESKDNRRTILQMSVWQDWLIGLAYVFPTNEAQMEVSELVWEAFSILLHHALRHEYGGWRVWVDTLAIAHSKVSFEKFKKKLADAKIKAERAENGDEAKMEPTPVYRAPEFAWSDVHVRLLADLLSGIERTVEEWKVAEGGISDQCNASENQVFVGNVVHVISQLADSLIMACGGLLPLLASATAPNNDMEIVDPCQQQLPISVAASFLMRFARLVDTFVLASGVSFSELEQEKNMPAGGVLRQSLRISATVTVRHILASRIQQPDTPRYETNSTKKNQCIMEFVREALEKLSPDGLENLERLVQDSDITRIKGVVYRDMVEENRQAQFLALSVIYLVSVLMVSRYRDILEPPSSPSPFFDSTTQKQESIEGDSSKSSPENTANGKLADGDQSSLRNGSDKNENGEEGDDDEENSEEGKGDDGGRIAAIKVTNSGMKTDGNDYNEEELTRIHQSNGRRPSTLMPVQQTAERRAYLTNKLQTALETCAPLLREMMSDFRGYLQKTLLGTHGQEIMNDTKVLETLRNRNASVIELVMLLCSQEWQTSLQKHAGLAFIELVNEGRLMAHATRDHVLRVANEADFILNRLRAEDVSKHAQFEAESREQLAARHEEYSRCDLLIVSGRLRDSLNATRLLEKMSAILSDPDDVKSGTKFWKLDVWEDDSRRRKRFVPNPYGSRHEEANLPEGEKNEEPEISEQERIRKILKGLFTQRETTSGSHELVDESDIDKWAQEVDPTPSSQSACYSTAAKLIAPGVVVPGTLSVTASDLFFDANESDPNYKKQCAQVLRYCEALHARWNLQEIRAIFLRRYLLQNTALELFLASRTAIMFAFDSEDTVKKVVYQLPRVGVGVKYGLPQSRKTSLMTPRQLFKHSDMCVKWQKREISNFDYLMFLNTVAGRTFNDLSQYPVFPWILTNYTSDTLDLSVASNFRDLSKPIGALSEARRKFFNDRYTTWEDDQVPAFHYGTHYSTPAFTLNWLLRLEPFASMFINLHDGKFDHPDRITHSIKDSWDRCQRDSHDVKELIPELFYLPEMFRNSSEFNLGRRADGTQVDDVVLPPWAESPEHFVLMHRQALESDLVSCQLNQWIDLIFGYKQRGAEAVRATNVFYHLTYEGTVTPKMAETPGQVAAIEQQILSFGQTPSQLLAEAHPPRHSIMSMAPTMFRRHDDDLCMMMKYISNSPVVYLAANTFHQLPQPTVVGVAQNLVFSLNKWDNSYSYGSSQRSALSMDTSNSEGQVSLPLTADPQLATAASTTPIARRHLGDAFDQRLQVQCSNFVTTTDSKYIFACGYPDYSFRIVDTDSGRVRQAVYGHGDVVTCIARSETSLFSDCYVVTGSMDCTVVLWHWNGTTGFIAGEYNQPGEVPSPRSILTGHEASISALCVSAEHGLVVSGCEDGVILIHTTSSDLLRRIKGHGVVTQLSMSRECILLALFDSKRMVTYSSTARKLNEVLVDDKIECVTVTRDGEFAVTGAINGRITIWRMFPLTKLYTYQQLNSAVRSVAVVASHRFILGGLDSGAIVVYNADFNRWHYEYKHRYIQNNSAAKPLQSPSPQK